MGTQPFNIFISLHDYGNDGINKAAKSFMMQALKVLFTFCLMLFVVDVVNRMVGRPPLITPRPLLIAQLLA